MSGLFLLSLSPGHQDKYFTPLPQHSCKFSNAPVIILTRGGWPGTLWVIWFHPHVPGWVGLITQPCPRVGQFDRGVIWPLIIYRFSRSERFLYWSHPSTHLSLTLLSLWFCKSERFIYQYRQCRSIRPILQGPSYTHTARTIQTKLCKW